MHVHCSFAITFQPSNSRDSATGFANCRPNLSLAILMYEMLSETLAMMSPKTLCATLALLALATTSQAADPNKLEFMDISAVEIVSDSSDRIDLANQLPMLSQRVAASACALTSDIEPDMSLAILEKSYHEFERIVIALRDGDAALNVPEPETRRITIKEINDVWQAWGPTHDAILEILEDHHDVDAAHRIDDHNMEILDLTSILASDISSQYTHPYEVTQSNAMLITIAGRQRMLTQKMIKDACEIWTHYHEEEGRADLIKTMDIFEKSLVALRDGMPDVGIKPAPTPEIRADLDSLLSRWSIIKGNQLILIDGGELDEAGKTEIFHDLNLELAELNLLVKHYTDYATKHH